MPTVREVALVDGHSSTGLGELSSPSGSITLGGSSLSDTDRRRYRGAMPQAVGSDGTLIRTKLHPPVARELVPRPVPLGYLRSDSPRRLTLIRAPAGWGKSSLLSAWSAAERSVRPFAWLSLDRGDNDPVRFFMYAIEALRTVAPRSASGRGFSGHPGHQPRRRRAAGADQRAGRAARRVRVGDRRLPPDLQRRGARGGVLPAGPCAGRGSSW